MAKKLVIGFMLLSVLQFTVLIDTVSAHRIYIIEEEPGKLKVFYEGNTAATRAVVSLLDDEENILMQEQVNKDGFFLYNYKKVKATKAIADDGLGHRTTFHLSAVITGEVPLFYKVAFGLSLLTFIAAYFSCRSKNATKTNTQDND